MGANGKLGWKEFPYRQRFLPNQLKSVKEFYFSGNNEKNHDVLNFNSDARRRLKVE